MFIDSEKHRALSDEAKKTPRISKKQRKIAQYYAPGREAEHRISRCMMRGVPGEIRPTIGQQMETGDQRL